MVCLFLKNSAFVGSQAVHHPIKQKGFITALCFCYIVCHVLRFGEVMKKIESDYELLCFLDNFIKEYKGDGSVLVSVVGSLVVGYFMGWRVLSLFITGKTYRKYQVVLGFYFKDVLPERGRYASRSLGLRLVDKFNNFIDVIQGVDKKITKQERLDIS